MMKLWLAPKGFHVEPADPKDAEVLARLHARGFYRGWPREDFSAYLADRTVSTYVACDPKHHIAGFAMFRIAGDEAELLTIAVDPKWRGKGLAGALLDAGFADLLMSPVRKIFLEVDEANLPAIRLYRRRGFTEIGKRRGYYAKPDGTAATALVMAANLE